MPTVPRVRSSRAEQTGSLGSRFRAPMHRDTRPCPGLVMSVGRVASGRLLCPASALCPSSSHPRCTVSWDKAPGLCSSFTFSQAEMRMPKDGPLIHKIDLFTMPITPRPRGEKGQGQLRTMHTVIKTTTTLNAITWLKSVPGPH